jgi:hypothetical protein
MGLTVPMCEITLMGSTAAADFRVVRGTCYVMVAFDVGVSVDLVACERNVAGQRRALRQHGRAVEYFEYRPAPLWMTVDAPPVTVGGWSSGPQVAVTVYDFGAVSVAYEVPCAGPPGALIELSERIGDAAAFRAPARAVVDGLLRRWGNAVREARVGTTIETYLLFHLAEVEPHLPPTAWWSSRAADTARLLRSEAGVLSDQETADAVAAHLAYGTEDATIVDWNAAVACAPNVDDIRTVTDFANVQLLEMRHLDRQLDAALDESYGLVSRRFGWLTALRGHQRAARRVAQMQVDAAVLFELVSSGLKIFGEQYLARAYRLLAERFRLADWDATIQRKLQTIESIYAKLSDEAAARRMELLEWIIVVLIAVSIVLPFL